MSLVRTGRVVVYPNEIALETDILRSNMYRMTDIAALAQAVIGNGNGNAQVMAGLPCTPQGPPTLYVNIGFGSIYQIQEYDANAYSTIPADTTDMLYKQGINLSVTQVGPTGGGPFVVPGSGTNYYLIQCQFLTQDVNATNRPYYDSSNPSVPQFNVMNDTRQDIVAISTKLSTSSTPTADSGWVPAYAITVPSGTVSLTSGNITVAANAPFITSSVINSVSNSAFQNSSPIFVTAGGSANVITASPTPAYGTLQSGTIIWIKASATNTGATSLNVSGLGAIAVQKQISTGLVALIGGEIITGTNYLLSYNGSVWEIINPSQPPFLCSVFYSSGSGTALTANAAAVKIPFDTARSGLDPNSMFDSVNQWIVAPITGFFNINVTLINSGYTGTAGSTGWPVYIYINSSLSFEICLNANGGDQTGASGSRSIKLNAGDKVEVYAAQGGTAPTDNSTVIGDAGGQFTTFDVGYIRS